MTHAFQASLFDLSEEVRPGPLDDNWKDVYVKVRETRTGQ